MNLLLLSNKVKICFLRENKKTENVEVKIEKDEDHFSIIENCYVKNNSLVQEVLSFLRKIDNEK